MDYLAALKEIYFDEWAYISVQLGNAICDDNPSSVKEIIQTYFSTPETRPLFDGEIALQAGAKKNDDACFVIPAFLAVITSNRNALEAILDFTENPNARGFPDDPVGSSTLLMEAAALGDLKTVALLLDHGANPNVAAITGRGVQVTALDKAAIGGFSKIVSLLLERNALITFGAAQAAMESEKSLSPIFVSFVTSTPSLIHEKCIEYDEMTLLHYAVGGGFIATVKWLISMGADVNANDKNGDTPLSYALRFEHDTIAEYPLANGDLADSHGVNTDASPNSSIQIEISKKFEVTQIVERLELLEEKMGISISGLYASIVQRSWANPPDFLLRLNFDIVTGGGAALENSFYLRAAAYNEAGQAIGKDETFIYNKEFLGFDSRAIEMAVDQKPAKIRLFPAK
jgi:hypothetical protein